MLDQLVQSCISICSSHLGCVLRDGGRVILFDGCRQPLIRAAAVVADLAG